MTQGIGCTISYPAIHLATAIEAHADLFLTGDADLPRCTEAKVEVLQP
ncbi:MAG: hypothetical protein ABSA52_07540 [Candidatus Binatia bacterium]|jgi:predicted nucleic acid-binding protein